MISCDVHRKPLYLMAGDPSRLHRDKGKILAKDYVEEDKKHWNSSITVMLFFFFFSRGLSRSVNCCVGLSFVFLR